MACGIHIIVDGLLAAQHQTGGFFGDHSGQQFGNGQRFDIGLHIGGGFDQDRTVSAHGQSGAQGFLRLLHTDGHHDHLGRNAFFFQADRLFDGNFVKGVHRHLHVRQIDTGPVRLDANLHVVIDHTFDRHKDLHRASLQ